MSDLTGRQFGKYRILETIGQGGMGIVYRALDTTLGRHVALKVLKPALSRNAAFVRRFDQEARTAARLEHPKIVTIYETGQVTGRPYIAMTLLRGQTLAKIIRRRGSLPAGQVLHLFRQIAEALHHAHQNGVVHRDVKPSNVLVDQQGAVTLTDFGIAAAQAEAGGVGEIGDRMGTPRYVAPEIVLGRPADARSDVYSLGVVLYEMLTGRVPFEERTTSGLVQAHVKLKPPSPREFNPEVPPAVAKVVLRALKKQPASRFATPVDMADALQRAYQKGAGARTPRSTLLLGAGGFFGLLALALAAWLVWPDPRPQAATATAALTATATEAEPVQITTAAPAVTPVEQTATTAGGTTLSTSTLAPTNTPGPTFTSIELTPITPGGTPLPTSTLAPTNTPRPTLTPIPRTNTPVPTVPPTATSPPPPPTGPTNTPAPAPPTNTPVSPTNTPFIPTPPEPAPTNTLPPPTNTPFIPTPPETEPTNTPVAIPTPQP